MRLKTAWLMSIAEKRREIELKQAEIFRLLRRWPNPPVSRSERRQTALGSKLRTSTRRCPAPSRNDTEVRWCAKVSERPEGGSTGTAKGSSNSRDSLSRRSGCDMKPLPTAEDRWFFGDRLDSDAVPAGQALSMPEHPATGIDTIVVSFRALHNNTRRQRLPGGGFVQVTASFAALETCAPKRLWDHNLRKATVAEAQLAVRDAIGEALPMLGMHADDIGRLYVSRLDVVRDFHGAYDLHRLLEAVASRPCRRDWRTNIYGAGGTFQTVRIGPRTTWHATLYDKGTETGGLTQAYGLLRFEARLRRKTLVRSKFAERLGAVVDFPDDLTDDRVNTLARGAFERVRFHEPILDCHTGDSEFVLDWETGRVTS